MKIALVNPKPLEAFTVYGPALGLCYLSSYLKRQGITNITGVDLNIDDPAGLESAIESSDVVGVYCSTKALRPALDVASRAKRAKKIVVMGGPHPSVLPEEVLASPDVDYVILSEGEESLLALIEALMSGGDVSEIDGLGYKVEGALKINPRTRYIANLDTIPFPDRDLFDFDWTKSLTVCATRGCPYKCANCQPALSLQTCAYRTRSVDDVVDELKQVAVGKVVHFVDNDLTINRKWIVRFCERLVEEDLNLRWGCQGRVNTLNKELLALMRKAGCMNVGIGIESGSQELLDKFLRKGINLQKAEELIQESVEVGMPLHGWFIIGIPTETKEDIEKTIEFAQSHDLASVGFSMGTPWPGTIFERVARENNWMLTDNWEELNEKRHSGLRTDEWGPEDIAEYRARIVEHFRARAWNVNEDDCVFENPRWSKRRKKAGALRLGMEEMRRAVRSCRETLFRG